MRRYISVAVIAALMLIATPAMAQKGSWEMSIAGNVENSTSTYYSGYGSSESDNKQTYVNVAVGRYFTNKFVGKVNVGLFGSDDGTNKTTMANVGVGVKFYFGEPANSKWIPFVDGGLNIVTMDSGSMSASGYGVEAGGGVSHFLSEEVSLDLSLHVFGNSMTADAPGDPTIDVTGQRLLFGITARY